MPLVPRSGRPFTGDGGVRDTPTVPVLFDGLGPHDQDVVRSRGTVRRFARNEVVFHDRDSSRPLHLVTTGHFAVRTATASGNSVTLRVMGPGEHFGELRSEERRVGKGG